MRKERRLCYLCGVRRVYTKFSGLKESRSIKYENKLLIELTVRGINSQLCQSCKDLILDKICDSKILWKKSLGVDKR